jgi:DNA-binding NtrC family response regulator
VQGGVNAASTGLGAPDDPPVRRTVLLLDAYPPVLAWTTRAFRAAGWQVLAASDARSARELCDARLSTDSRVALLVTDLDVHALEGASLARELLQHDAMLKVIALSGDAQPCTARFKPFQERTALVRKPVRAVHLLATAEALCSVCENGDRSPDGIAS